MHPRLAVFVVVTLAGSLGTVWAATPAIGIATARGDFRLDDAQVSGNATVLEGSLVETGLAGSELRLYEGVGMRLSGDSRGQVFRNRLVLERGAARIDAAKEYAVDAEGVRVVAPPNSAANVNVGGEGRVEVAAISGAVRVTNEKGVLLAEVLPGKALAFSLQAAGAAAPEKLTGVLFAANGHYFLTDKTAGLTVELSGSGLDKLVGKLVEVTGALDTTAKAAGSAAHVLNVSSARIIATAAAKAGASVALGLGTKAVVAGVGIAAAAGPAALAVTQSDDEPSISR
jgi:hypothetical protein